MPTEIEKLVDTLLKKVYGNKKQKIGKHANKMKNIRKKKRTNKKQALSSQFKYANNLLKSSQKRLKLRQFDTFTPHRQRALKRMSPMQVDKMWNDTQINGANNFSNIYKNMGVLDWIGKQQSEYKGYNDTHANKKEKEKVPKQKKEIESDDEKTEELSWKSKSDSDSDSDSEEKR